MLIRHSTFIESPTHRIWAAATEIDTWSAWAPTVQSARRLDKGRLGIASLARIKQPMQSSATWTVTAFEDGIFFAWESTGRFLRMRASHELVSHGSGTKQILTLRLSGPLAWSTALFLAPFIRIALGQVNRGLKHWCEAVSQRKTRTCLRTGAAFCRCTPLP